MGADQSKNPNGGKGDFTKSQVEMLLKHQKQMFDEKYNEILRKQNSDQSTKVNEQTIREEAKKEVERIFREKYGQNATFRQTATSSASTTPTTPYPRQPYGQNTAFPQTAATPSTSTTPRQPYGQNNVFPQTAATPSASTTPRQQYGQNTIFPQTAATSVSSTPTTPQLRQPYGQNNVFPQTSVTPSASTTTSMPFPRTVTSFSYTQNQLVETKTNLNSQNTVQKPLYPIINRPAPPVNVGTESSYVFVNKKAEVERQRNRRTNANVDDEYKCPTCKQVYTLTVYQCSKGHSSCKNCKESGHLCGICKNSIGTMRNIALEAFISEKKVNCPNSSDGCSLFIKIAEKESHAKVCLFRIMPCPLTAIFGQCNWKGKINEMSSHFDDVHQVHRQADVDSEMYLLNVHNGTQIVHFVVLGTFNFLFHLRIRDDNVYVTVQALGTDNCASKWLYDIHIYNKREPRRKFQHIDACHSINIPVNDIFSEFKCAVIPLSYASTFINEGKLAYKFYIKKEFNNNEFVRNQRGRGGGRRK
ncbi:uncharacterized protein ACR2FA_002051 [Aphomia sociella]